MANQWFKFYGAEYLSDPKMDRLTVQERSCWLTLLCMASQSNGRIKFLSVEGLLNKSGITFNAYDSTEWDNSQNVLHNFEIYEMIKVNKDGVIEILNWEKRQEHNLTVAERVAKSRALKKNVTTNVTNVTIDKNRIDKNRIEKIRKEENLAEQSSAKKIPLKKEILNSNSKEIPLIFKEFESINPAVKRMYGNTTQRQACSDLIENYTFEKVIQIIKDVLPKIKGQPFFPEISTPLQLFNKWSALESAVLRYGKEKANIKNKYPIV